MASAVSKSLCTVFIKMLNGDLLSLEVDPSVGLKGICEALTRFDSEAFPPFQTKVFFIDESVTTITNDIVLGVLIYDMISLQFRDEPDRLACRILSTPQLYHHLFERHRIEVYYNSDDEYYEIEFIYDANEDLYASIRTCNLYRMGEIIEITNDTFWFPSLRDLLSSYNYIPTSHPIMDECEIHFKYSRVIKEFYYKYV